MNIELLAVDIASRVKDMAMDCMENNVNLIRGLIEQEIMRSEQKEIWKNSQAEKDILGVPKYEWKTEFVGNSLVNLNAPKPDQLS